MDYVIDSESCNNCGHDHYPMGMRITPYASRRNECVAAGCDCSNYQQPDRSKVYKCSGCYRMVTRVRAPDLGEGHYCNDCHNDD